MFSLTFIYVSLRQCLEKEQILKILVVKMLSEVHVSIACRKYIINYGSEQFVLNFLYHQYTLNIYVKFQMYVAGSVQEWHNTILNNFLQCGGICCNRERLSMHDISEHNM